MNKVSLVGRLTRNPEVKRSEMAGEVLTIARFTVAVDRKGQKGDADFISCVAFSKTAEFVEKYFSQGMRIGLCGHIQTGSYTKQDGTKVYTTDVFADEVEFVESKSDKPAQNVQPNQAAYPTNLQPQPPQYQQSFGNEGFMNASPEGLPFR